ncbi:putative oxidoreductase [Lachnellula arida]|uniref:Putative oxidoreductase n=1 Tax=Lachnellula arida TaxID=1316785 RepID=A0A8T9BAR2_9HELO|nr:putative oxidoreductase [Lachnellula arida]
MPVSSLSTHSLNQPYCSAQPYYFINFTMVKGVPFEPAKDIPSLAGKVILITGGSLGLGKQTALDLAKHNPSELWITSRSAGTGKAAVKEIEKASVGVSVHFIRLDLSSFESVKETAKTFRSSVFRLDIFYMNAGIMGGPHDITKDGYERQFGINHMGHALLFKLLQPLMLKTALIPGADVRVVSLSSVGHRFWRKDLLFDSMKKSAKDLSPTDKYCHSKLANLVYARALAKYVPEITSVSVHPGVIRTGLFTANGGNWFITLIRIVILPLTSVSVEDGVQNQLWAGTAKDVVNGEYYEPVGIAGKGSSQAYNDELAKKLWDWTAKELEGHVI